MRLQAWHFIVLLVVVLIVFGANKLPDITRNVGRSMKIFKEEVKDLRDDTPSTPPVPPQAPIGHTPPTSNPPQTTGIPSPDAPPPTDVGR
ncbi:MAG: Sec-independent protein translocase subunit TatA [Actinomycetales bacterium]|nr:Sec-independent protein translocase subunit TatA [Actinomycetales bacterium]